MKNLFNNKGLTLIEIIVTLALLGIIIGPIMVFFISSQKINNESEIEYKSIQLAQKYMEKIKSMDKIDINLYKDDDLDGIFERVVVEDNYTVNIEIKPASNNLVSDETIMYDAALKVGGTESFNEDYVYWNSIPYANIIENGIVDLIIGDSIIILGGNELATTAAKINVVFNTNAELNIINSSRILELYIESNSAWKINVEEGIIPKIFDIKEEVANNILYDITVNVTKGARKTTVEGTKIFK